MLHSANWITSRCVVETDRFAALAMSETECSLPVENVRRMAASLLVTDRPSAELLTLPPPSLPTDARTSRPAFRDCRGVAPSGDLWSRIDPAADGIAATNGKGAGSVSQHMCPSHRVNT